MPIPPLTIFLYLRFSKALETKTFFHVFWRKVFLTSVCIREVSYTTTKQLLLKALETIKLLKIYMKFPRSIGISTPLDILIFFLCINIVQFFRDFNACLCPSNTTLTGFPKRCRHCISYFLHRIYDFISRYNASYTCKCHIS